MPTTRHRRSLRHDTFDGKTILHILLGIACGAIVGAALGVFLAMGVAAYSQWSNPDDPSAGAVGIIVIFTMPMGAIIGGFCGVSLGMSYPRLVRWTLLPLSLLVVGLVWVNSILRGMDRPREYVVEVVGTDGAEYTATMTVDGRLIELDGTIPERHHHRATAVECSVVLRDRTIGQEIGLAAWAGDKLLASGFLTDTGVQFNLIAVGYSETFGGTSRHWHRMSEDEADGLAGHNGG